MILNTTLSLSIIVPFDISPQLGRDLDNLSLFRDTMALKASKLALKKFEATPIYLIGPIL